MQPATSSSAAGRRPAAADLPSGRLSRVQLTQAGLVVETEVVLRDVAEDELALHHAKPGIRIRRPKRRYLQVWRLLLLLWRRRRRVVSIHVLVLHGKVVGRSPLLRK